MTKKLVAEIHDHLVGAGFERVDGTTNEFRAPSGLAPPTTGHNSVAADQLRLFIERIERLEEEKKGLADDVKDVYAEAKSTGFDAKTMRKIVALRKLESHVRIEADALLETYATALGLQLGFNL